MHHIANPRAWSQRREDRLDLFLGRNQRRPKVERDKRRQSLRLACVRARLDLLGEARAHQLPHRVATHLRHRYNTQMRPKLRQRPQHRGVRHFLTQLVHQLRHRQRDAPSQHFIRSQRQGRDLDRAARRRRLLPGLIATQRKHVGKHRRRDHKVRRIPGRSQQVERNRIAFGDQPRQHLTRLRGLGQRWSRVLLAQHALDQRGCRSRKLLRPGGVEHKAGVVDPGAEGVERQQRLVVLMPKGSAIAGELFSRRKIRSAHGCCLPAGARPPQQHSFALKRGKNNENVRKSKRPTQLHIRWNARCISL